MNLAVKATVQRPLIAIIGPTGVGKTALSLHLAQKFPGEIVSADSRLFYRGMDIGTDKPGLISQQLVQHHLIDIRDPDDTMTLGQYVRLAAEKINHIQNRNLIPYLVGGTGQYIRAVLEGWKIPRVAPNERMRSILMKYDEIELARWLFFLDPDIAPKIDPRNMLRTVRALEVILMTGRPMSELQRKVAPSFNSLSIGMTADREILYKRLDDRVDRMMANGLLEEVVRLKEAGYQRELPAMSGLGYRQLWAYLEGECTIDNAVERIKFETHRFVRQQYTWFSQNDVDISWFNIDEIDWKSRIDMHVDAWLQKGMDQQAAQNE